MRKNRLLALSAAMMMVVGCGTTQGSKTDDSSAKPEETSSATQTSVESNKPASSSSSSKSSSSKSSSSSSTKTPTTFEPSFDWSSIVSPYGNKRDYQIFDKVPEIKFTTTEGLNWATQPNRESDKPEVAGTLTLSNCDTKFALDSVAASMKVRGNYTSNYQKKPFRIKFDAKQSMLGLNKGGKYKKWVLLADVKDTSMLRNSLGFYLGRNLMDDKLFASDFTPVHLYLNNQYWGLYILAEQKEVKSGRVEVAEPPANYSGTDIGYLMELDHYYKLEEAKGEAGDPTFTVDYKPKAINYYAQGQQFGDGKTGDIEKGYTLGSDITDSTTQIPFIKKFVENVYTVMYNAAFNNTLQQIQDGVVTASSYTDAEECLSKVIDIDSFVAAYILSELACDPDVGYSSFYLSADMSVTGNKLLTCNCPWDFDTTFGIRQGTVENSQGIYAAKSTNMWLSMLPKLPFFMQKVKAKWNAAKEAGVFAKANDMISEFTAKYVADYKKNYDKWPRTMGSNPETNFEVRRDVQQFKTQAECYGQMSDWFNKRVQFLDGAFNEKTALDVQTEFANYKKDATKTRLEAESAVLEGGCAARNNVTGEGVSSNGYVGDLDGNQGRSMTFTYNAAKAGKVLINAGLSARTDDRTFGGMFTMDVNGTAITPESITIPAGTNEGGARDYHFWTNVDVAMVDVKAGANQIKLTSTGQSTNFDYIDVYAK